jgi:hypothetical protein
MRRADVFPFMADAWAPGAFSFSARAHRNAGGGVPIGPSSAAVGRQRLPSMPASRSADSPTFEKVSNMVKNLRKNALSVANIGIPVLLLSIIAASAHAFTAPVAGDLGYDIYDIVVNQGVKGPLGFVGGVAAFLFGVSRLFSNIMIGIPTIVAAVCLIKADSILQTFGMVI